MSEEGIKKEDEINLPSLNRIAIQFLRFVFSIVGILVNVIKESKLLLLTGLFTGLVVGFSYYSSKTAYYEVSMIAESPSVYRKTLAEMIESLDKLITSQSYGKLAAELGISEQHAGQMNHIEMTGLLNESLENDTSTKFNQPFKIIASIKKPELTDTFQNAIENYLNNKPSFKTFKEEQTKYYKEKLAFIDAELAKLDTLKTEYNRFFASSKITTTYYSNDVDPSSVYKHANDLFNEKGAIMVWLVSDTKALHVIDEFKAPALPQSVSRSKSMLYGSLIGLGICFLLGLYMYLHRKINHTA
jgi:hypothetical protein